MIVDFGRTIITAGFPSSGYDEVLHLPADLERLDLRRRIRAIAITYVGDEQAETYEPYFDIFYGGQKVGSYAAYFTTDNVINIRKMARAIHSPMVCLPGQPIVIKQRDASSHQDLIYRVYLDLEES